MPDLPATHIRAGDFLRMSADRFPDRACFVYGDGSQHSFAETNGRVNRLSSILAARGIGKGDRVAIFAVNCNGYAEVLFACMKLGITYVPINNRLGEADTAALLARTKPAAIFVSDRYTDLLRRVTDGTPQLVLRACFDLEAAGFEEYEKLVASGEDIEPDVAVADGDILGLAFTSGTTGGAKGVLQSQAMIKAITLSISLDYEIQADEFRYSSSPMFHIGGQSPIFSHVWRGVPTLVLPQFDVDSVLAWMQGGQLTGLFLVPTMISMILEHPSAAMGSYDSIRSIIYGAAPMSPALLRRSMEVFGCEFVNAFGAGTEVGLQTVLASADHKRAAAGAEKLLGSIGKPAFGVDLRLVDENDNDVPRGEVGEIITRSEQMMTGYLDMPEKTAEAFRGGWFHAGDLASMDSDGYLYLAGRRSDLIIRGGENIYPIEIEDVITAFSGVSQAAVIGVPDEHWSEIVVAYLTAEPGAIIDSGALRAHCRAGLAAYKVPSEFRIVAELPTNASGKILKRDLRAAHTSPETGQRVRQLARPGKAPREC